MNNDDKYLDRQYINIVRDILDNEEFEKMSSIVHHGLDRKSHSIRVSYYSYKIARLIGLDYVGVARAGLLHDFFFENNQNSNICKRLQTLIKHPDYALANAGKYFDLTNLEKDIIRSHMFPISINLPLYAEGWLVNLVDDLVAISEVLYRTRTRLTYSLNFVLILMFTYLR